MIGDYKDCLAERERWRVFDLRMAACDKYIWSLCSFAAGAVSLGALLILFG